MRHVVHVALVWIIAISLVAGTAAWRSCTAAMLAAGAAGVEHHEPGAGHAEHDHLGMHRQHVPEAPAAPAADDHGCLTCCSMCTVAAALPAGPPEAEFVGISSDISYGQPPILTGRTVQVDPGIPKRID